MGTRLFAHYYAIMRPMRRAYLCLLALTIISCGGGGGGAASPFAGNFIGTWDAPGIPDNGTANVTVATNGTLNGSVHDNGTNANGVVSGTIANNGTVNGAVQYPGQQPSSLVGTLTLNVQNHLVGTLTQDGTWAINFDLVKQ